MAIAIASNTSDHNGFVGNAARWGFVYQRTVREWIVTRFGAGALDLQERVARLVEEACELAQAAGMPLRDLEMIAAHVYEGPRGHIQQEAAGLTVTLFALAAALGFDLKEVTDREIERITLMPAAIFRRKQAVKAKAGIGRFPDPQTSSYHLSYTSDEDLLR